MANISNEMKQALVSMLVESIGTKVKDGITYVLLLDSGSDQAKIEEYKKIQTMAGTAIRSYQLKNGYVFDMDLGLAKELSASLVATIAKKENMQVDSYDQVKDGPERRREEDIQALAKFLAKQYKEGKKSVDIALFSRNKVDKIEFTAKNKQNQDVKVTYPAFAIRHWDMQRVGEILGRQYNIALAGANAGEVLPTKTGVRFAIVMK